MNLLEDWIKDLIKKPLAFLNDKYPDEDIVKVELDSLFLPLVDSYSVEQMKVREAGHVSNAVLQKLHKKIRNRPCEETIWSGVFWYLANPLPGSLAHDLVDRWIATIRMGSFTRQVDEVQWRLATFNEDALYTLVRERYQEPEYSTAQFETMLRQYAPINGDGILYMLSFYETPSPEKKAAFMAALVREKRNWRKYKHTRKRLKQFIREQSQ